VAQLCTAEVLSCKDCKDFLLRANRDSGKLSSDETRMFRSSVLENKTAGPAEDFQGWQFVKVSVRMVDQEPRLDNSFASGRTDVEVVGGRGQTACTALYCFDCIQYVQ
jgi:hypothetical protein